MDKIIVLKYGGSMIDQIAEEFFEDIKKLQAEGYKPIIVHGGGPAINQLLTQMQIESEFVNGLRKTTKDVMEVVEMVLSGTITNKIVRKLSQQQIKAVGVTGSDAGLITAQAIDKGQLGLVGNISKVNSHFILELLSLNIVPVISPIAVSEDGDEIYNINADTAAGAIATAVSASKLLFVTDVPGVMKDNKIITNATVDEINQLIADGTIYGGMIPKVQAAIHSLESGMKEVMIISGLKRMVENDVFIGTTICKEQEAAIS